MIKESVKKVNNTNKTYFHSKINHKIYTLGHYLFLCANKFSYCTQYVPNDQEYLNLKGIFDGREIM